MQPVDWMLCLQQEISPDIARVLIRAYIHEPHVIRAMQQNGFLDRVLERDASWTMADLALVAMGSPLKSADLMGTEMVEVEAGLRSNALQTYEKTHKTLTPPANLAEAGLLAIALRERRRLTNGWYGLMGELTQGTVAEQLGLIYEIWKTPLACLYHMVPDGIELCQSLLPRQSLNPSSTWISHIMLANPIENSERVKLLTAFMRKTSIGMQTGWLRELSLSGETDLVLEISRVLLASTTPLVEKSLARSALVTGQPDEALKETMYLQHLAELYRLSGQFDEAEKLFQQVQWVSRIWLAGINVQLADLSWQIGNPEQAQGIYDQNQKLHAEQVDTTAELVISLGHSWQAFLPLESGLADSQNPLMMILRAEEIGKAGDLSNGQELACQAVELWLAGMETCPSKMTTQFAIEWKPEVYANALIDLGLDDEAISFTRVALMTKPADETLTGVLVDLLQKKQMTEFALEMAGIQASLNPDMAGHQRTLAKLLNATGRWPEAYHSWKRTLRLARTPSTEDWLGLAEASLAVNDLPQTIEMCNLVLEQDENHGKANRMLGRALVKTGHFQEAIPVLGKATALCPEETQAWLDMADAYRNLGENQKVLEILRAASLAVSNSSEIFLALGETCQQAGLQAEALPAIRKAAQLRPDSETAAIQLGNILLTLGYLSEAQSVLIAAVKRWPENPDLALIFARVSLALGDHDAALQALEIAIRTDKPEIERYILLAETLLEGFTPGSTISPVNSNHRLERAKQVLETALTWMPDHELGLVLHGEILLACSENQGAYEVFSHLYESKSLSNTDNHWRLLAGFGLSALRTGEVNLALSALQDAILMRPEMIGLHRLLAEAYLQANQRNDAIQRARYALKLDANNESNLLWFADLMGMMEETAEAISAMQVITQLAPERSDYWLKRAGLEVENGDLEAAQKSLQTMLNLSELNHDHYRLAALTYLRMQDQTAAMACLDLACEKSSEVTTDFLLEMTCLNFRLGRHELALESCCRLAKAFPNDGILQVLQADLLCGLERWQPALISLDQALEIWEKGHQTGEIGRWQRLVNSGWIRADWLVSANRLGMISMRKALIYNRMNESELAEQHVEMTLQQVDHYMPAIYLAVELALGQNNLDQCNQLLEETEGSQTDFVGLRIENHQLRGEADRAAELLRQSMIDRPRDFRLRILQVCQLSQRYDWAAANSLFDRLLIDYKERKAVSAGWPIVQGELMTSLIQRGDLLRLVDQALALRRWQNALELASECVRIYGDSAAHLRLAKVLIICAEQQRLYTELNISAHAPGVEMLSVDRNRQFELVMEKAGLQSYQHENLRWFKRGQLAFQGTVEYITDLASVADNSEDCVALMAALRRNKNMEGVKQLAGQYPQEPAILAELALAQLATDAQDAQLTAQHLAEISPSDPVHLVILTMAANHNEDWMIALGALENALQIWPDEAEWHAWAADMADKVNAGRACQAHWEQALTLEPKRVSFALSLGRTYNSHQVYAKAASVLRRAVEITDQHPEIWMELARALQGTGEFVEALECAGKAADLLPEEPLPLLLSGEIALTMGKLDWALAYAQEAYKIANRNEKVVLFLARVMEKRGKLMDGLALIEKSLVNMDHAEPLIFEQARLIRKISGPKAALPVLIRLANDNSASVEALSLLAQVQADCGDLAAAEQSARKALAVNPDDLDTNLLLGRLLHKAGQLDQAIVFLKLATTGGDNSLDALMELGRVYQARREFQPALQIYQQAIMHSPKDHLPYLAAGAVLREAKDYRGSEAMFRRAAELAPDDVNIQRQLGAVVALNLVYESQEVKFSYGQH